ncbi:MAG TPA: hypothetical protein VF585_07770 [Chthoniobacterales bacterium]|jgi:hypothetical protein
MSLKAFHVFFIVIAIVLSFACSFVGWNSYRNDPEQATLAFGVGFSLLAVGLAFYGVWFVKKSKAIII